ncbi:MAG: thiamine pyrophosphate-dependent enzyme [Acidimicrobiia bacterium]|nr:thiamine pyrophosphate-dependent enzyme [Acidimicrobiia bacterium]
MSQLLDAVVHLPPDLDRVELALLQAMVELAPGQADGNRTGSITMDPREAAELFEAQVESRLVDHTARWLRSEHGAGFYTIGSAGHESNGAVAMALRPTDPALLHYRSGGFYFARAYQQAGHDPVGDVLRGMMAATTDQISGGRHKVFGNKALSIIPQTSTIASHLPRAVGLAISIGWTRGEDAVGAGRWPVDSVVVCSFGDASLNHSTAQGAINWASNAWTKGQAVPVLFLCEDNGLGLSVPTPEVWVEESTASRPALAWARADGHAPAQVLDTARRLVDHIRETGQPGFLHLRTVRFLGHAGTDVETAYRSPSAVRLDLDRDPILGTAGQVVASGTCSGTELVQWYLQSRTQIRDRALDIMTEPRLTSAAEVMAPLHRTNLDQVTHRAVQLAQGSRASVALGAGRSPDATQLTLAQTINQTLATILEQDQSALVFGEDVGRKGGVYGVTRGLQARFGAERVFDTILDEQTVFGLALGASLNGHLTLPEIQYLAYLHNAEDQLRGEAASLKFFSNGQYTNPMVVRIAGYGYQRGFGGHFHNDNSVAVLRDIPGLIIASPSHPSDAAGMLISCAAAAEVDGSVCAYLEPIARYHTVNLLDEGDGGWTAPLVTNPVPIGSARVWGRGSDGTILTWGNGLFLSLRAQRRLWEELGESWRVVDLRWLAPLPVDDMVREGLATGRVLVVDETRYSGGVGEGIVAAMVVNGFRGGIDRIAAHDSFIPLGPAAELVLVGEDQIVEAARNVGR